MTQYTKSTNFTSKDSLASGNPLKIVKGTEIDAEFNNIAIAVATKADLLSPAFTGFPSAPTAASGTSNTQLATTAFVTAVDVLKAPLASPTFTGTPTAPTATSGTSSTQLATTAFVTAVDVLKAPLVSPTFTGVPTAPTAASDTTTTQLATTAFVVGQAATSAPLANGNAAVGTSKKYARQDHVHAEGGIGVGQTWQDVTASRAINTTYTNSTGKSITLVVTILTFTGSTAFNFIVGGVTIPVFSATAMGDGFAGGTIIVPPGATYSCSTFFTHNSWLELR